MELAQNLLRLLTPRRAALLAAAACIMVLAGAQFFEHVLGIRPCSLCLSQRIPYYIALPLALLTGLLPNRSMTIRLGLAILALVFLFNAGLAAYHSGVEWKFWDGPAACSGAPGQVFGSAADLLSQMQQTAVVSCAEASWRFFGLSLAGWNVLISLGLAALVLLPFKQAPDQVS